jgi:hypothetical protein
MFKRPAISSSAALHRTKVFAALASTALGPAQVAIQLNTATRYDPRLRWGRSMIVSAISILKSSKGIVPTDQLLD